MSWAKSKNSFQQELYLEITAGGMSVRAQALYSTGQGASSAQPGCQCLALAELVLLNTTDISL